MLLLQVLIIIMLRCVSYFLPCGAVNLTEFSIPKFHSVYCMLLHVSKSQIQSSTINNKSTHFVSSDHDQSSVCKV